MPFPVRATLPLLVALLLPCGAVAAPGKADVEKAAVRVAGALDGVLRNCPTSFTGIGTGLKACVGSSGTVESVRVRLGAALGGDLYGVWRSRDEQRSVFNWVKTPAGYVYLRLQPDPDGRAQTLVYLDVPPVTTPTTANTPTGSGAASVPGTQPSTAGSNGVTLTRPTPPAVTPTPPAVTPPATGTATRPPTPGPAASQVASSPPLPSPAPVPFARVLEIQANRMNGEDVRAVQNRLIRLTQPNTGGRGDGYYGPVTAATVRAFQAANALPVTGKVDRATWELLFSSAAKPFKASAIR